MGLVTDLIGGWIGGEQQSRGEESARDASYEATQQILKLQRDIYNQQRSDQMPWLQQGTQAINLLGQFYGFNPSTVPGTALPAPAQPTQAAQIAAQNGTASQGLAAATGSNALLQALRNRFNGGGDPVETMPAAGQPPAQQPSTQPTAPTTQPSTQPGAPAANPQQAAMDRFFASPDYQFRVNEGNRNLLAGASATGGLQSGDTLKALQSYGQNMASGEFGNYWNRLAGLAGVGQTAAGNIGQAGQNYASGSGGALMQDAANRGSSYIRTGNNWSGVTGGMAGAMSGAGQNVLRMMGMGF